MLQEERKSSSLDRSSEPTRPESIQTSSSLPPSEVVSPSKRKELEEKLAQLNSRYVLGFSTTSSSSSRPEVGKVGLAALQDIAARQEAALALDDVTPTNQENREVEARYDPGIMKMVATASPGSVKDSRYESAATELLLNIL